MMERLILFETAKLAKEKGFIQKFDSEHFNDILPYREDGTRRLDFNYNGEEYDAVIQSTLQSWLRDNHKIHISIDREEDRWKPEIITFHNGNKHVPYGFKNYASYEDALEQGLINSLNIIK